MKVNDIDEQHEPGRLKLLLIMALKTYAKKYAYFGNKLHLSVFTWKTEQWLILLRIWMTSWVIDLEEDETKSKQTKNTKRQKLLVSPAKSTRLKLQ